ncbi:MAG: hypothetical protein R2759_07760 [Bacteroidales bacterium]
MKKFFNSFLLPALFAIFILAVQTLFGQQENEAPQKEVESKQPNLTNLNYEIGKVEIAYKKYESGLNKTGEVAVVSASFSKYESFLKEEAADFRGFNPQ